MSAPGTAVYHHDDGSECLWTATEQKWLQMHPLYPTRECGRPHDAKPLCEGLTPFRCGNPSCPAHGTEADRV